MAALRIIFAGGGTGGHLFPAIAIAEEFRFVRPDAEILFVGTKDKIEAKIVPQCGFKFQPIWVSGFHRKQLLKNVLLPIKVIIAMMQSVLLIKKFQPDIVIGTGGYASGPVVLAAAFMNVPTVIHEQNSYPGVTTRLLAKLVNQVHVTFETTKRYLSNAKSIVVSGNPTRRALENVNTASAYEYFGFPKHEKKKTLLVFGGSLGARTINTAMINNLEELLKREVRIIWQTGKDDFERVKQSCSNFPLTSLWIQPFIERMDYAYAISDLVVCRAGATTIAEITRLGMATILIPYPQAAGHHQLANAKLLADAGAAAIVLDHYADRQLLDVLLSLINDEEALSKMRSACKKLGKPDAAQTIVQHTLTLLKQ